MKIRRSIARKSPIASSTLRLAIAVALFAAAPPASAADNQDASDYCGLKAPDAVAEGAAVKAIADLGKFAGSWKGYYDAGTCTGLIVKDATVLYVYGKWGPWGISSPGALYAQAVVVDGKRMTITSPHGVKIEYALQYNEEGIESLAVSYGARNYKGRLMRDKPAPAN